MAKPWKESDPKVYQIKVTLRGIKPPIWRRLLVPSAVTLGKLHAILQAAMGWQGGHLHQFVTGDDEYYGIRDPDFGLEDVRDESRVRLDRVLRAEKASIVYEYDFGDGWEHTIVLEKILPASAAGPVPRCVAGKRACPPEDCGGVPGYYRLLDAIADPKDPEHKALLEWVGGEFDPEHFDPVMVNVDLAP